MIRVEGVTKRFGDLLVLDAIDLDVAEGECVCLLGPSGCGKSTLLNAVAGFTMPTDGTIVAGGTAVTGPAPERGAGGLFL